MRRTTILLSTILVTACGDDSANANGASGPAQAGSSDAGEPGTTDAGGPADTSSGADTGASGPGVVLDVGSPGADTGPSACPCADDNDLVFLLDGNHGLWTFDPQTMDFEQRGTVTCPGPGPEVWNRSFGGMAVDRSGRLTLVYTDITIVDEAPVFDHVVYSISAEDPGDCQSIELPIPTDRVPTAISYASIGDGAACDDIYLFLRTGATPPDSRLGRIDDDTDTYTELGPIAYDMGGLSGTGDGRLFSLTGFIDHTTEAILVQYDVHDAHEISSQPTPGIDNSNGLDTVFWANDIYFFNDNDGESSRVMRLDLDGNAGGGITTLLDTTPIWIIAATNSTCAPYTPVG